MADGKQEEVPANSGAPVTTVAGAIIDKFLEELGAAEGYADVATNLRKVIVEQKSFSEADIRKALFGDVP